jgi:hypothetical protein
MSFVGSSFFRSYLVNPYHLVEFRPWPIVGSVGALFLTGGLVG